MPRQHAFLKPADGTFIYFQRLRHVSDWGDLDFGERKKIAAQNKAGDVPYVMQGYGRQKAGPGLHWAWVPNKGINPGFQHRVSKELGQLLQKFISSASADDLGILINVSHAWIRWFDAEDKGLLRELLVEAKRGQNEYVRHNLSLINLKTKAAAI